MSRLTRNADTWSRRGDSRAVQQPWRPWRIPIAATLGLAILLLLSLAWPVSAVPGWTVTKITDNAAADEWPYIDATDSFIVWQTQPSGQDSEICLWNIDSGSLRTLTSNTTNDGQPKVDGDYVVWQGWDGSDWEIYLHRISTAHSSRLTNDSYDDTNPEIRGDLVVWSSKDPSSGGYAIRAYSIATASVTILTTAAGYLQHPKTDGSWVVWEAQRVLDPDNDWEIECWNGSTLHRLTDNAYEDRFPEISDQQVVWQGKDGADWEVFYFSGGSTVRLTNNTRDDTEPLIDVIATGTAVAWRQHDGSDYEVCFGTKPSGSTTWTPAYMSNNSVNDYPTDVRARGVVWFGGSGTFEIYGRLASGEVVNFSESPLDDRYPRIGQSALVWQGRDAGGDWEIFLATPGGVTPDEAPEVQILQPEDGAVLTGSTAEVSGTAADDVGVSSVQVSIDGGAWLNATIDSGTGTTSATWHYDWSLPMEDNDVDHVISARVADGSSHTGDSADDPTVRVDRKDPAISDFAIDAGAAETDSSTVTLTYTVTDGSPPLQMRFTNDGTTWSAWEPFAGSTSWALSPGAGTKTVWCSFKDALGNVSGEGLVSDTILLTQTTPPATEDFADVPPGHPYHDAIYGMRDADIIDGYQVGDTWEFRPGNTVFRAQFAKMICGVMGLTIAEDDWPDAGVPFTDLGADILPGVGVIDSLYPHEYVAVAYLNQITKGQTATTFSPYVGIKRAQIVTMIVRAAQNLRPGVLAAPPAGFSGSLGIFDPEHGPNMLVAESNGLLAGLAGFGPTWSPWTAASRGETAQILWNLMSLLD